MVAQKTCVYTAKCQILFNAANGRYPNLSRITNTSLTAIAKSKCLFFFFLVILQVDYRAVLVLGIVHCLRPVEHRHGTTSKILP
jgi:hypothetical protein